MYTFEKKIDYSTVRKLFKRKTPSFLAHFSRHPFFSEYSNSEILFLSSMKIFFKEGGNLVPFRTLNARPLTYLIKIN